MLNGMIIAVAAFGLFVSPWVLRNQRVMHAPILTRSNFGVELWQSTHFYWEGFPWGGAMPLNPKLRDLAPEELDLLQLVHNYGVVQAVLDRASGSDLEVSQKLSGLIQRGFLRQF